MVQPPKDDCQNRVALEILWRFVIIVLTYAKNIFLLKPKTAVYHSNIIIHFNDLGEKYLFTESCQNKTSNVTSLKAQERKRQFHTYHKISLLLDLANFLICDVLLIQFNHRFFM